ncbi:MAG: FkbM family methyltransferase [Patescibacteria group bacterium]
MNHAEIIFNQKKITGDWRDVADESVWTEIFKLREYRRAEEIIANSRGLIVDVGAHAGFFSLYCRALNPQIPIIAVEPEPRNIAALNKHLKLNRVENVLVEQTALAAKSGKRELFVSPDSSFHYLLTDDEKTDNKITVNCITLNDLAKKYRINGIDLLKMDIEGGEYELVKNWGASEWGMIRQIVMEYHDHRGHRHGDIKRIMNENGFSVEEYPSKFDSSLGFIFARNKKINHK